MLFNQHGDCLAAKLRAGNVSSAEDWDELLLPEIERQQGERKRVTFRADAAFAKPEIYEALEDRGVDYVIRIPANKKLEWEIADILFRPPGRPSAKPLVRYKSFRYQAESWSKPRRIVAKVEHHPATRTAAQDQELVADESAAPADEDRRTAGQARPVLLALIGGGTSEPAAVWRHAAEDLGAACARWVALPGRGSTVFGSKKVSQEQCRPERRSVRSTNVCERTDEPWRLSAEVMCRVQREKTWYSGRRGCILSRYQGQNGNPGLMGIYLTQVLGNSPYMLWSSVARVAVPPTSDL